MYVPAHFAADNEAVRELLSRPRAADLGTMTPDGLVATFLPFLYDGRSLLGHVARNNDQWSRPVVGEALVIVHGPDAYISPGFYASKAEHGRVVPTWNYLTAHVYGELVVHDDVEWLDALVRRLTDRHEATEAAPWSVDDAPPAFVAGQLRAIVGVELVITPARRWCARRTSSVPAVSLPRFDRPSIRRFRGRAVRHCCRAGC